MEHGKNSIGIKLRKLRGLTGYTIRYVAKQTGLAPIRISQWERGIRTPSITNLVILATFYGVMVDELLRDLRLEVIRKIHGRPGRPYGDYYEKIKEKPP